MRCPVLVVTDVGKDIDDTLALLYLAHLHQQHLIALVGIVTTGGRNRARALAAQAILQCVNIACTVIGPNQPPTLASDELVIVAGKNMSCLGENVIHVEVNEVDFGALEVPEDANADSDLFLNQLMNAYAGKLRVVVLGPLTDLASCAKGLQQIHSMYLQGHVDQLSEPLLPSADAFNFKCDMGAARTVFDSISSTVPFYLLGKYAAYTVGITPQDFDSWDRASDFRLNLKKTVLSGINHLRTAAPDVYGRVFGTRNLSELQYLSRPYDPMLCVLLSNNGDRFFEPTKVGHHSLIGISPAQPGIKNRTALHDELKGGIQTVLTNNRKGSRGSRRIIVCWVALTLLGFFAWRRLRFVKV